MEEGTIPQLDSPQNLRLSDRNAEVAEFQAQIQSNPALQQKEKDAVGKAFDNGPKWMQKILIANKILKEILTEGVADHLVIFTDGSAAW